MDTISRENNSMLPVGAVIVGVIGLIIGGYGAVQASKANKALEELRPTTDKIPAIEQQAGSAAGAAEKAAKDVRDLTRSTQDAFNAVGGKLAEFQTTITKLEEAAKKPAPAPAAEKGKKGGAPAVAGPGEYLVKAGDGGTKIAQKLGVSIGDLQAVNPGVNWNKLSVGQKLKVPQKK